MRLVLLACLLSSVNLFFPMQENCRAEETSQLTDAAVHFEEQVRPILASQCIKCHGPKKQEGGLRLDSNEAMLKGGDSGPAIVPKLLDESLLIEAVRYEGSEMPPTGQLSEKEILTLEAWVLAGAEWPEHTQEIREASGAITAADREWWAFQPLSQTEVPVLEEDVWSINAIDQFVFQKMVEHEILPAPQAERAKLVRRLYYDLIGLPPTPEEITGFLADDSDNAWEKLIDRLLADERYGEHWARFWLDVVRYAESDGWNKDSYRPYLWRYRDYVVNAFNNDKPYPQFVREQLAGDEIPGDDPQSLIATGYLRLGIYEYNQRDARAHWNDIMNEITNVTGDVFLGVSMACARCHDHKFDPLLQTDYYTLRAFFEPIAWRDDLYGSTDKQKADYQAELAKWEDTSAEIRSQMEVLIKPHRDQVWKEVVERFPVDIQACYLKSAEDRSTWEHQMAYLITRQLTDEGRDPLKRLSKEEKEKLETLRKELATFDAQKPKPLPAVMVATDFQGSISPTLLPDAPENATVVPRFISVLSEDSKDEQPQIPELKNSSGRRTALAEWIGRPDNPLTTRVFVNRIWQQHFGQGIVSSANDFGHLGQLPTHPALLDWLTVAYIENNWSVKWLHKQILMSAVWRQSAHHPQASEYRAKDPAENLLWRCRIRRLQAEQIRDAMLTASGELQQQLGGPSIESKTPRRSLYIKSIRNAPDAFLHAFDVANGLMSVSERNTTTTPTQSLLMINGDYVIGRAEKLAARLREREGAAVDAVAYAVQLVWGREPAEGEVERILEFIEVAADEKLMAGNDQKLIDFCQVLFNSNEFIYVD